MFQSWLAIARRRHTSATLMHISRNLLHCLSGAMSQALEPWTTKLGVSHARQCNTTGRSLANAYVESVPTTGEIMLMWHLGHSNHTVIIVDSSASTVQFKFRSSVTYGIANWLLIRTEGPS